MEECSVCFNQYTRVHRRPVVGKCGHTLCFECSSRIPTGRCVSCRQDHSFVNAPTNFALLRLLEKYGELATEPPAPTAPSLTYYGIEREETPAEERRVEDGPGGENPLHQMMVDRIEAELRGRIERAREARRQEGQDDGPRIIFRRHPLHVLQLEELQRPRELL